MNQQIQVPVIGEATFQPGTATTRHNVFVESRLRIMRNVTRETRVGKMNLEQGKEEASCLKQGISRTHGTWAISTPE